MPESTLRTQSASPLYAQMMDQIRRDIQRGVYPVGVRIPTEHELEGRYGVSRVTVRRALQELTNAGLLERKQGKGTFVAQPKAAAVQRGVTGFHEACRELGLTPSVGFVSFREMPAGEDDRSRLGLGTDAMVLEITRTLLADGEPVILETLRFSMAYVWLENANLKGSLYRLLQEYGIQPEKSLYDLSLCRAEAKDAELLRTTPGTWLMDVSQVVYDQKGRPLHTARRLIRGDRYVLRI